MNKNNKMRWLIIGLLLIASSTLADVQTAKASARYDARRITSSTTTTVVSTTVYVQSLVISVSAPGTTWTLKIQNKESPAKILYQNSGTGVTAGTTYFPFSVPVLMTSGIDIVTAGTAGTMDVFTSYWP